MPVFSSGMWRRTAWGALFLALLTGCVLLGRCARAVADNAFDLLVKLWGVARLNVALRRSASFDFKQHGP